MTALVANLLVLGTLIFAGALEHFGPDLYYLSVQEDEILEWGTFWAFVFAAAACVVGAVRQYRTAGVLPWFLTGVTLFCLFVALEEISWGQRILGYRPPVYFLEHNFQQEFNLHNVVDTQYRKLALQAVILGYGVLLPLAALVQPVGRWLSRLGVVTPSPMLMPAFAATFVLYVWYPWKHTGEWVEFMLGAGFLFAALITAREYRTGTPGEKGSTLPLVPPDEGGGGKSRSSHAAAIGVAWVVAVGLGSATAAVSRSRSSADPENLKAAEIEIAALQRDFSSGRVRTRCGG